MRGVIMAMAAASLAAIVVAVLVASLRPSVAVSNETSVVHINADHHETFNVTVESADSLADAAGDDLTAEGSRIEAQALRAQRSGPDAHPVKVVHVNKKDLQLGQNRQLQSFETLELEKEEPRGQGRPPPQGRHRGQQLQLQARHEVQENDVLGHEPKLHLKPREVRLSVGLHPQGGHGHGQLQNLQDLHRDRLRHLRQQRQQQFMLQRLRNRQEIDSRPQRRNAQLMNQIHLQQQLQLQRQQPDQQQQLQQQPRRTKKRLRHVATGSLELSSPSSSDTTLSSLGDLAKVRTASLSSSSSESPPSKTSFSSSGGWTPVDDDGVGAITIDDALDARINNNGNNNNGGQREDGFFDEFVDFGDFGGGAQQQQQQQPAGDKKQSRYQEASLESTFSSNPSDPSSPQEYSYSYSSQEAYSNDKPKAAKAVFRSHRPGHASYGAGTEEGQADQGTRLGHGRDYELFVQLAKGADQEGKQPSAANSNFGGGNGDNLFYDDYTHLKKNQPQEQQYQYQASQYPSQASQYPNQASQKQYQANQQQYQQYQGNGDYGQAPRQFQHQQYQGHQRAAHKKQYSRPNRPQDQGFIGLHKNLEQEGGEDPYQGYQERPGYRNQAPQVDFSDGDDGRGRHNQDHGEAHEDDSDVWSDNQDADEFLSRDFEEEEPRMRSKSSHGGKSMLGGDDVGFGRFFDDLRKDIDDDIAQLAAIEEEYKNAPEQEDDVEEGRTEESAEEGETETEYPHHETVAPDHEHEAEHHEEEHPVSERQTALEAPREKQDYAGEEVITEAAPAVIGPPVTEKFKPITEDFDAFRKKLTSDQRNFLPPFNSRPKQEDAVGVAAKQDHQQNFFTMQRQAETTNGNGGDPGNVGSHGKDGNGWPPSVSSWQTSEQTENKVEDERPAWSSSFSSHPPWSRSDTVEANAPDHAHSAEDHASSAWPQQHPSGNDDFHLRRESADGRVSSVPSGFQNLFREIEDKIEREIYGQPVAQGPRVDHYAQEETSQSVSVLSLSDLQKPSNPKESSDTIQGSVDPQGSTSVRSTTSTTTTDSWLMNEAMSGLINWAPEKIKATTAYPAH